MTIQPITLRVQEVTVHALDRLVEHAAESVVGGKASRNSVAAAILDREAQRLAAALPLSAASRAVMATRAQEGMARQGGLPASLPAILAPPPRPATPSDVDRLRAAMGSLTANAVDRLAYVARGTCRQALKGNVPLAKAGKGGLLRWVVAVEAQR